MTCPHISFSFQRHMSYDMLPHFISFQRCARISFPFMIHSSLRMFGGAHDHKCIGSTYKWQPLSAALAAQGQHKGFNMVGMNTNAVSSGQQNCSNARVFERHTDEQVEKDTRCSCAWILPSTGKKQSKRDRACTREFDNIHGRPQGD